MAGAFSVTRKRGEGVDTSDPYALLPAFMLAEKLGVTKQLIYYWRKSGKLSPAAEGMDGRPLYRLLDGQRLEARMRNNPRSSRGKHWADRDRNTGGTTGQPAYAA